MCYASLDEAATNLIAQNAIVINLISRDSTTSEIIDSILNNTTVIVTTISIAASILCKVAIKIFRFGVNYKSNFASVEQQKDFELIKRQYKHVADIMTYDDLAQRLRNIIASLEKRV